MAARRWRAAVIGCGRMGAGPSSRLEGQVPPGWLPSAHAEALIALPEVELIALCDPDAGALQAAAARFGIAATYSDHRTLIAHERPDLVCIATRTPEKAAILAAAIDAGVRGVYVEKPLATSVAIAQSLLESLREAGVVIGYGVNRRFHAVYRHARRLIADGAIGDLLTVTVEHGRSMLLWTHPHSVDLIRWVAQSPVSSVQAVLDAATVIRAGEYLVDSDPLVEHAYFRFANGVTGAITSTGGLSLRLGGTEGVLTVRGNGASIELHRRASRSSPYYLDATTLTPPADESATIVALRELVRSMDAQGTPGIDPAEIVDGIRMLTACAWSHLHGGRLVGVGEVPDGLVVTGRSGGRYA